MDPLADSARPGSSDNLEGQVLGSYSLERLLGEGSMGRVYQARHSRLGREVAVKVLRAEHARNSALVVRFFEEARTVNRISHAHIVEIFDFVEDLDSGHVFCVMELLRGQSLAERLREGPMPLALVLHVARQLCSALAAAHAVSVVHRDLKPDNIFLVDTGPGSPPDVKVLDFGVAKLLTGPRAVSTLDGTLVGTPLYMSPEQAAGLETDRRADLYAVGNLLFEMLAGRPPFADGALGQLMVRIITTPAPALPGRTAGGEAVPRGLVRLVARCLEKEASARPASAEELLAVLEGRLRARYSLALPPRALRALAAAGLAVAAAGAGALGVLSARAQAVDPAAAAQAPAGPDGAGQDVAGLDVAGLDVAGLDVAEVPLAPLLPEASLPPASEVWSDWQAQGLLADLSESGGAVGALAPARAARKPVVLQVDSEPGSAVVTRADTGEWLGVTPLRLRLPASERSLALRVSRPGRQPATRRVRLDQDSQVHVALPPAPASVLRTPPSPHTRDDVLDPFGTR
jgi:serine/threonine-protein kinase